MKSCDCTNKEQKVIGGIVLWNFTHKIPSVEAYNQLRVNAGMNSTKPLSEVKKALEGTLFLVSVYEDDELIGLGRIVGDGGVTFVYPILW